MAIVSDNITGSKRISGMGKKLGVSNDGDLQQFFDKTNKNQLWYFNNFTTQFPNGKWMKYKPQKLDTIAVGPPTDAQRKAGNWGFINLPWWQSLYSMVMWGALLSGVDRTSYRPYVGSDRPSLADDAYWKYDDPSGWASTSYRRAEDFEGALSIATFPISGINQTDDYIYINTSNYRATVPYDVPSYLYQSDADYALQFADFLGTGSGFLTGSYYFGVAFARMNGSTPVIFCTTQQTTMGYVAQSGATFEPVLTIPSASSLNGNYYWRIIPFLSSVPIPTLTAITSSSDKTGSFTILPTERDSWPSTSRQVLGGDFALTITSVEKNVPTSLYVRVNYTVSGAPTLSTQHSYRYDFHIWGNQVNMFWSGNDIVNAGGNYNGTRFHDIPFEYATQVSNVDNVELIISKNWTSGSASTAYSF